MCICGQFAIHFFCPTVYILLDNNAYISQYAEIEADAMYFSNINKGNSRIPVFKCHKSNEREQIRVKAKTEGNTSTIRGKQTNNWYTDVNKRNR